MVDPGLDEVHQLGEGAGVDESRLALVDTACTMCMHSTAWRLAFNKHLPADRQCYVTDKRKKFTFAGGGKTPEPCPVWVIPISFDGRDGEIHSTEVPTGTTPLLLSISVMEVLDAVVHVKDMVIDLKAMGLKLKLLRTGSRHLGVDVSKFGSGGDAEYDHEEFGIKSQKGDVFIYLVQEAMLCYDQSEDQQEEYCLKTGFTTEAPRLGERGVRQDDKRAEQKAKRAQQLSLVAQTLQRQDAKTWTVLKMDYTLGERYATRGFKVSVIFEPEGGSFGITNMGARRFGWTNSQPLDLQDGYDLVSKDGQDLLFNVLHNQNPYLTIVAFDCRVWSVMANMNPHIDWQSQRNTTGAQTLHLVVRICKHRLAKQRHFLQLI